MIKLNPAEMGIGFLVDILFKGMTNISNCNHVNIAVLPGFSVKNIAFPMILVMALLMAGCEKEKDNPDVNPTDKLALDSLVATKKHIITWEEITVKAYARGENLKFEWYTNHGSMVALDSVTVLYWACPSCEGLNIIECTVTNNFGTVSDTVMIQVDPDHGL